MSQGYLNALKFKWHPTNSTLDRPLQVHLEAPEQRGDEKFPWPRAFSHQRARIVCEDRESTFYTSEALRFIRSDDYAPPRVHVRRSHIRRRPRVLTPRAASSLREVAAGRRWIPYAVLHFVQKSGLDAKQVVAFHALFEHDIEAPPDAYHKGMCRLWRAGLPEVNLLANRAVTETQTVSAGALGDDGEPCKEGQVYGMESLAWHSDLSSRPAGLPVRTTCVSSAEGSYQ